MNASVTHQQQLLPSQRAHRTGPVTRRSTSRMSTVTRASTVRNNTARGPSSLQTHILTRSLLECEFPTPSRAADPFPFLLPPQPTIYGTPGSRTQIVEWLALELGVELKVFPREPDSKP